MFRSLQHVPTPQPLRGTSVPLRLRAIRVWLSRFLLFPLPNALSSRLHINIIPKVLAFLCFHTLTHSFAPRKTLSPIVSAYSTLFGENIRVGYARLFLALPFSGRACCARTRIPQ